MSDELEALKERLKKSILISADEEFLRLLDCVKDHVKIDQSAGPVLVSDVGRNLTYPHRILLYLLALRAGKYLDLLQEDSADVGEISGKTGIPPNVTSVRLSELTRRNLVFNLTGGARGKIGRYRITDYGIQRFRTDVLPRLREQAQEGQL